MARYNDKRTNAFELLTQIYVNLKALAELSSDADKALLSHAVRAQQFASVWMRCTTEMGRRDMKMEARNLVEKAALSTSPLHFAFIQLGNAWQRFGECEYKTARDLATQAAKQALIAPR